MTRPLRILIVDDLPMNLKLLRVQLESEGHTVLNAANGVEALAALERLDVDMVISDILMPIMDGYRLCYEVRHDPRFRELPFIAYTASYVSHSDEKLSLDLGADRYLRKPASVKDLVRAIDEAIASPGHRPVVTIDTTDVLKEYSERLVAKLEKRNLELHEAAERLSLQGAALNVAITVRKSAEEKLRQANEQLVDLLAHSPAVTYAMTLQGEAVILRLVSVNITRLLGFSMDEMHTAEWWTEHIHPEDRSRADARIAKAVDRGVSRTEYRVRHQDGKYRWIDDNQRLVRDAAGTGMQVAGVWTDITERREAQASMRESEAWLRAIFEASRDGILVEDDGEVVLVNASYAQILGYETTEELLGKQIREIAAPEDVDRLNGYGKAHLRGEFAPSLYEFKARKKDGSIVDLEAAVSSLSVSGTSYVTTAVRDITERKRVHALAHEQASLIDQAHDAIVVTDRADLITFWSRGAERLYGYQAKDVLGAGFDQLLRVKPRVPAETGGQGVNGAGNAEIEKITSAGARVIVESSWTSLRDDQGNWRGILSIDSDITGRKDLEKQFFRAQRLDSLGTLAGGIAHDLNNLLMPILMGVTMLKRLGPDERTLKTINNMERSVTRGRDLVKRVLLFASGTEGEREPVDLGKIVADVKAIIGSTFPKNITFATSMPDTLHCAIGDVTQLTQVMVNLCVNARDAMQDGGKLSITASNMTIDQQYAVMHGGTMAGRYVVLEVADNGSGIPREIADRIFEPFFTTKDVGKGTGLGLSTVQGVLRGHNGFIDVASEVGRGTTFRVFLPAHSDEAGQGMAQELETDIGNAPRGNGEVILVVDDEAPILEVTRQTLEAFGYSVLTAQDGAQAIGIYARDQARVAVVLTDMMMPIMSGASLIAALRRISTTLPIIAASGYPEPHPLARVSQTGASRFLSKPYSADVLLRTLSQLLNGSDRHGVEPLPAAATPPTPAMAIGVRRPGEAGTAVSTAKS